MKCVQRGEAHISCQWGQRVHLREVSTIPHTFIFIWNYNTKYALLWNVRFFNKKLKGHQNQTNAGGCIWPLGHALDIPTFLNWWVDIQKWVLLLLLIRGVLSNISLFDNTHDIEAHSKWCMTNIENPFNILVIFVSHAL